MRNVNGAALLARALKQAGSGPIFTLSGNQVLPVYDAGIDAELRFVDTRHESAAAHMADAWGRLTGQPGVCLVTAGPGHTNALTGLATAWMAESPMVLLSGGADYAHLGKGGFQEIDQLGLARPICKAAWMPSSPAELPQLVAHAWRTAQEGTPGPVHITLPFDVLQQEIDPSTFPGPAPADFEPTHRRADADDVRRAAERVARAERPVVLGGPAAWRGAAGARLRELLARSGMPGFLIASPRGLTDPSLHGLGSERAQDADAVLPLASQDFTIGSAARRALAESAAVIQVAPEQREIGRNRPAEIGLVGDASTVPGQLVQAAGVVAWPEAGWRGHLDRLRAARAPARRQRDDRRGTTPPAARRRRRRRAAARGRLRGSGRRRSWPVGPLGPRRPGRIRRSATASWAASACRAFAIAAAIARPRRTRWRSSGTAPSCFHGMERYGRALRVPCVIVVGNDAAGLPSATASARSTGRTGSSPRTSCRRATTGWPRRSARTASALSVLRRCGLLERALATRRHGHGQRRHCCAFRVPRHRTDERPTSPDCVSWWRTALARAVPPRRTATRHAPARVGAACSQRRSASNSHGRRTDCCGCSTRWPSDTA